MKTKRRWYLSPCDNTRENGQPEAVELWIERGNVSFCLLGVSENEPCDGVDQDIIDKLELACTAVNSHDGLVSALEAVLIDVKDDFPSYLLTGAGKQAKAALDAAKETK